LFNAPITSGAQQFSYVIPHSMTGQLPYYCVPHCATGMVANITIAPFLGDANGSGIVDIDDLLMIINAWGPCP
jgi:hypothetical protein